MCWVTIKFLSLFFEALSTLNSKKSLRSCDIFFMAIVILWVKMYEIDLLQCFETGSLREPIRSLSKRTGNGGGEGLELWLLRGYTAHFFISLILNRVVFTDTKKRRTEILKLISRTIRNATGNLRSSPDRTRETTNILPRYRNSDVTTRAQPWMCEIDN